MSAVDCLIAIPCFRESERLPPFLETLCPALAAAPFRSRVLVVDDGSGPEERARMEAILAHARSRWPELLAEPLWLETNLGKGGAVYAGWQSPAAAEAPLLGFVDADGSVPAEEVVRLVGELHADAAGRWGAIFGCRVKLQGTPVERIASRHYVGRVFTTLTTLFTGLESYDSQCGLKVLRRESWAAVVNGLREMRFVFDVELTLHLLRAGVRLREVPIEWHEVPGSKVHVLRDGLRMASGLLRIRRGLGAGNPGPA